MAKTTWRYRIVCEYGHKNGVLYHYFSVREVYSTHGQPHSCTEKEVSPFGETSYEFYDNWEKYVRAVAEPIIYFHKNKFVSGREYVKWAKKYLIPKPMPKLPIDN